MLTLIKKLSNIENLNYLAKKHNIDINDFSKYIRRGDHENALNNLIKLFDSILNYSEVASSNTTQRNSVENTQRSNKSELNINSP